MDKCLQELRTGASDPLALRVELHGPGPDVSQWKSGLLGPLLVHTVYLNPEKQGSLQCIGDWVAAQYPPCTSVTQVPLLSQSVSFCSCIYLSMARPAHYF